MGADKIGVKAKRMASAVVSEAKKLAKRKEQNAIIKGTRLSKAKKISKTGIKYAKKAAKKIVVTAKAKAAKVLKKAGVSKTKAAKVLKKVATKAKAQSKTGKKNRPYPLPNCGPKPDKFPKPIPSTAVGTEFARERYLAKNILKIKAFSLAAHSILRKRLLDQKSKLFSLGQLVYTLGNKAYSKKNAAGEYLAIEAQFKRFYCFGLGKYFVAHFMKAMRSRSGVLRWAQYNGRNVVLIDFKKVGFTQGATFLKTWAVTQSAFNKMFTIETGKAKPLDISRKFAKSGCKCVGASSKWGTCKKYFAYDAKAWCVVQKGCASKIHNQNIGDWAYCA